jgi:hypothetical protein
MAMELYTKVVYSGTNIGRIYIGDVGRRAGLGGGVSIYQQGQDKYIKFGETRKFVNADTVQLSVDSGTLKHYSDNAAEARFLGAAPLVLTQQSTAVTEVLV